MFYANKWNIGYVPVSKSDFIKQKELGEVKWLLEEESDYSADPFVVTIKGKTYIFYEFLNMWKGRGQINRIENFDFRTKNQVRKFADVRFHISYPYIFKDGANIIGAKLQRSIKTCTIPTSSDSTISPFSNPGIWNKMS